MNSKKLVLKIIVILFYVLYNNFTVAKNSTHIVLKINNEIITNIDIEIEKRYLLAINQGLESLNENEISQVAKASLIREKIKKNELEQYFDIEEDNKYLENLLKNFYTKLNFQNIKDLENYLLSKNITLDIVKEKLNIEALWNELIFNKFSYKVEIDEQKLKEKIKNNFLNEETQFFLISEIVFEASSKTEIENTHKKILDSIADIGFANTANIYSISETSKFGGEIGWINTSQLSMSIYNELKNLKIGEYTSLLNVPGGFLMLNILDKKKEIIEKDEKKELQQLIVYEKDRQLNEFSAVYFQRIKKNSLVNEK
tara:strand:+ start:5043 stop:5984 length:942 start_codon:yes stop_codon:yes gene_type:complete